MLKRKLSALWRFLLPNSCQLCGKQGASLVCPACCLPWLGIQEYRCLRCARGLCASGMALPICGGCISQPPAFLSTFALGSYSHPQDQLLWALKFGGRLPLAHFFAEQMAYALNVSCKQEIAHYHTTLAVPIWPDLLVPIPLSPKRLAQRGYNQAWEIARCLGRVCTIPARADWVVKTRETERQMQLPLAQRVKNLRGAFVASSKVAGRHIAVVDDVMTTGFTLHEVARSLLRAGALSVRNYVVLRASI